MEKERVYLGIDVHKDTLTLSAYRGDEPKPRFQKTIQNDKGVVRKHLKKIAALGHISCCYEDGFSGYDLYRFIDSLGYQCQVIAPSLVPERAGDRVKTDRKDSEKLAKLLRAGLLSPVAVPTVETERIRGFIRLRYQIKEDLLRTRQRILKFLHTKGLVFRGSKSNWTQMHRNWLCALNLEAEDELVLAEHVAAMSYLEIRLRDIDGRIEEMAAGDRYREPVGLLKCFKGISTFSAMVLLTEIGDFRRFPHPRELMSYIGLTPSEHSSGASDKKGRITKCGNKRLRHIMVEAAWHYTKKPALSYYVAKKHRDQPREAVLYATAATHRLHKRYWALASRRDPNRAVVAVARELVGFVWGMMTNEPNPPTATKDSLVVTA